MIFSIAYHPGGRRVATASYDMFGRGTGEVRLWDVTDGREVLELPGEVWVAFSADGRRLAAPARGALLGESNAVRVWDGGPFPLEATFRGEGTPLFAVAADPTGQVVAASGSRYAVTLYDRAKRKPPRELTGHTSHIGDVDISSYGRLVASASDDRTIRLWDISTGKEVKKLEGHTGQVTRVRFDPTGEKLISTGADRAARVWDVATGRELLKVDHPEGKGMDLALSADGGRAVICAENGVRIWDVTTGETLRQIRPPHPTTSVAWRDGTLVTGDNTGLVHVWDAESGEHRREWEAHSGTVWGLAFTREGVLVSGGSDRLARAWNPDTGKRMAEYPGHFDSVRRVTAVPEGFATVSWDGTVRFWAAPGKQP
jgi:WD40 repeat protein